MRKRLYFLLPDVARARQSFQELLLSHIDERHIHVIARDDMPIGDLPEATMLQKSNAIHGLWHGVVVGGATGIVTGTVILFYPPAGMAVNQGIVLITSLVGAIMGVWIAGMIASDIPNSQLTRFDADIEKGKVLMIVDVPRQRVEEITAMIRRDHPEADMRGVDPTIPAFP
jgi:hypothetical protein